MIKSCADIMDTFLVSTSNTNSIVGYAPFSPYLTLFIDLYYT